MASRETYFDEQCAAFDNARWSMTCRQMQVRIMRGDIEQAHEILQAFCRFTGRVKATMQSPLAAVLPVRIANALEDEGYVTVQSAAAAFDAQLAEIDQFGPTMLGELRRTIEKIRRGEQWEQFEDDQDLLDDGSLLSIPGSKA